MADVTIKALTIFLAVAFAYSLVMTALAGRRLRELGTPHRGPLLESHTAYASWTLIVLAVMILFVEFVTVKHFGRQHSLLFPAHLAASVLCGATLVLARVLNGVRMRRIPIVHRVLGTVAAWSGVISVILGIIITLMLHS